MSKRDHELATTKYKNKPSASSTSRAKEAKSNAGLMDSIRQVSKEPRSKESVARAAKHKLGLPRLG